MLRSRTSYHAKIYNECIMENASYDIPSDTVISDILESYYSNMIDDKYLTAHESSLIDLIKESLTEVLDNRLDYRSTSFSNNLKAVSEFIETSKSKFTLLQI